MVEKSVIQKLHDKKIIDKRHVLWWQLGFEGREILDEDKFNEGLEIEKWIVKVESNKKFINHVEKEFKIWKKDDVPILLKNINFRGVEFTSFVSVKPKSHGSGELDMCKQLGFPSPVYYEPHIRGVVIEKKDKFLFWYPLILGIEPMYYSSRGLYLNEEKMWALICPIHPTKFYKNLINDGWSKGRRVQKKSIEFDFEREKYKIVPYFEFNLKEKHVMVYPFQLIKKELDFPVIIKSNPKDSRVEIIGIGTIYYNSNESGTAYYWNLTKQKKS